MQDDLADMFEDMNEVNDLMGRAYGTPEGLDDDDLEAELAALGDEFDNELVMDELDAAAQHAPSMVSAAADEGRWQNGCLMSAICPAVSLCIVLHSSMLLSQFAVALFPSCTSSTCSPG
jgi:hypothetical protein